MSGLKTFVSIINSLEEEIQKEIKLYIAGESKFIVMKIQKSFS